MIPGADLVAEAQAWIGTPYRRRAHLKGVGCDCVGLVRGVFREARGVEFPDLPPYPEDWAGAVSVEPLLAVARTRLEEIPAAAEIRPGDVLAFRVRPYLAAQHCAIAETCAGGKPVTMIHAIQGHAVAAVHLSRTWAPRLVAAFRG